MTDATVGARRAMRGKGGVQIPRRRLKRRDLNAHIRRVESAADDVIARELIDSYESLSFVKRFLLEDHRARRESRESERNLLASAGRAT